jgi:hypothetical protein
VKCVLIIDFVLDIAKVTHIHLGLNADFDKQILDGYATLTVEKVQDSATHVVKTNLTNC